MTEGPGPRPDLRILWAPLLASPVFYIAVGYLARKGAVPDNPSLPAMMIVFGAVAAVQTAGIFLVMPKFAWKMPPVVFYVLRWALSEAVAIYGLILFLAGAPWSVFLSFAAVSMALLLILRPGTS